MADNLESRIRQGSLTLYEWESLAIDRESFESLEAAFTSKDGSRLKAASVIHDKFGTRIKAGHHVGAVGFSNPVALSRPAEDGSTSLHQIIVLPKITQSTEPEKRWLDFLRMFEVAYNMSFPDVQKAAALAQRSGLVSVLAWLYAAELEKLFRRHLRRNYLIRVDTLNGRIKGKLLLEPYLRQSVARMRPEQAVCQFYELTANTLLNQVIKAAIRVARRLARMSAPASQSEDLAGRLSRTLSLMSNVSDVRINRTDVSRIRLHSMNRYYRPALAIAKLLLFDGRFHHEVGNPPTQAAGLLFDMNQLFERFVTGLLHRRGHSVEYQSVSGKLTYGRPSLEEELKVVGTIKLKPDIVINDAGAPPIIVDAKYKEVFGASATGVLDEDDPDTRFSLATSHKLSISPRIADIYQMVTYLDNRLEAEAGYLVYPWLGEGQSVTWVTGAGTKRIGLVALGLENWKIAVGDNPLGIIPTHRFKKGAFPNEHLQGSEPR